MRQDQRVSPRCSISQLVQMRHGYERWRSADIVDISRGGIRCASEYEFSPGDTVYFLLSLDTDQKISADATAIHTRKAGDREYETGFSFTRFYDSSEAILNAYIDETDGLEGCRDDTRDET